MSNLRTRGAAARSVRRREREVIGRVSGRVWAVAGRARDGEERRARDGVKIVGICRIYLKKNARYGIMLTIISYNRAVFLSARKKAAGRRVCVF